jgi:hypothetical protein
MKEPKFVNKSGKTIFYCDFSGLKKMDEILEVMDQSKKLLSSQSPKSVYALTNLSEMYFNTDVYNAITKFARGNEPFVKASAVIGMNGLMQIFYNSFLKLSGRDVRAFKSENDAINYLINFK